RPLMPPASLHHFVNTSPASNSSWSRPGRPANPGSALVAMLIAVGVTPWAGEVVFWPGPHTFFSVPKSPAPAAPAGAVVLVAPGPALEPLRPHAPATS